MLLTDEVVERKAAGAGSGGVLGLALAGRFEEEWATREVCSPA